MFLFPQSALESTSFRFLSPCLHSIQRTRWSWLCWWARLWIRFPENVPTWPKLRADENAPTLSPTASRDPTWRPRTSPTGPGWRMKTMSTPSRLTRSPTVFFPPLGRERRPERREVGKSLCVVRGKNCQFHFWFAGRRPNFDRNREREFALPQNVQLPPWWRRKETKPRGKGGRKEIK